MPGKAASEVWARVSQIFKLGKPAFETKILARCPVSIRETNDEAEVARVVAALNACGAVVERFESDGNKWNFESEGRVRGPVPTSYLKQALDQAKLTADTKVIRIDGGDWSTLQVALDSQDIVLDVPTVAVSASDDAPKQQPGPPQRSLAPSPQPAPAEPAGKALLKAVGWFALAAVIYSGGQYVMTPSASTGNPFHGRVKLISLGLEFVSCEPDGSAYKCVVRAMQPMDVREQCAYFDSQGRIVGSPKNVSDLNGVNFAARETRVVTVYAFDKEVTTIECNYVPETYKHDALMKGLPDLKKEGVAWEIDI